MNEEPKRNNFMHNNNEQNQKTAQQPSIDVSNFSSLNSYSNVDQASDEEERKAEEDMKYQKTMGTNLAKDVNNAAYNQSPTAKPQMGPQLCTQNDDHSISTESIDSNQKQPSYRMETKRLEEQYYLDKRHNAQMPSKARKDLAKYNAQRHQQVDVINRYETYNLYAMDRYEGNPDKEYNISQYSLRNNVPNNAQNKFNAPKHPSQNEPVRVPPGDENPITRKNNMGIDERTTTQNMGIGEHPKTTQNANAPQKNKKGCLSWLFSCFSCCKKSKNVIDPTNINTQSQANVTEEAILGGNNKQPQALLAKSKKRSKTTVNNDLYSGRV